MCLLTLTPTLGSSTRCGLGGAGVELGVAAAAGAGWCPIGTLGGKRVSQIFLQEVSEMWPWYGYWHPWGWRWLGYWGATPYDWPWGPIPKEQEIAILEDEARWLERDLDRIKKRLEELRK